MMPDPTTITISGNRRPDGVEWVMQYDGIESWSDHISAAASLVHHVLVGANPTGDDPHFPLVVMRQFISALERMRGMSTHQRTEH